MVKRGSSIPPCFLCTKLLTGPEFLPELDDLRQITKLAALVLCMGAILHTARLLFRIDWVLQNFATPAFDMALAVPLTIVAVCLWAFRVTCCLVVACSVGGTT